MEVALPVRRAALREGAEDEDCHDGYDDVNRVLRWEERVEGGTDNLEDHTS